MLPVVLRQLGRNPFEILNPVGNTVAWVGSHFVVADSPEWLCLRAHRGARGHRLPRLKRRAVAKPWSTQCYFMPENTQAG